MLVESNDFILGIGVGLVISFVLFHKKLKELRFYIKKDEEIFDEKSNLKMKARGGSFDGTSGYFVNTERFGKIELEKNLKGLNAFYDHDWAIIGFRLRMGSVEKLLDNSSEATDKHVETIRKKIKRGEIVMIPQGFITNEKINKIIKSVSVEVYSKEEDKNMEYLLCGANTETVRNTDSSFFVNYFCLPNGRVICSNSLAHFSGMHKSDDEIIKKERRREKEIDNYIWEILTIEERGGISKKDFMEILAVQNEYMNKIGGFKAFNTGKFSKEKMTYIQKEILKRKGNYSLKNIKIVEKAFFAYQEKDRIENREAMVKGKAKRNDESHLYLGKIDN